MAAAQLHAAPTAAPTVAVTTMAACTGGAKGFATGWQADSALATAKAKAGGADPNLGTSTVPFWVQTEDVLEATNMLGGCKCGNAVCTIGRMCIAAESKCILPPCPFDSIAGKAATVVNGVPQPGTAVTAITVPALYAHGCWCAALDRFHTYDVAATSTYQRNGVNVATAPNLPLIPGEEFSLPGFAEICLPGQVCDFDGLTNKCTGR